MKAQRKAIIKSRHSRRQSSKESIEVGTVGELFDV
jgi:hypothetical protein